MLSANWIRLDDVTVEVKSPTLDPEEYNRQLLINGVLGEWDLKPKPRSENTRLVRTWP
jgi:hypothetical protein